jgi:hypothetical protein
LALTGPGTRETSQTPRTSPARDCPSLPRHLGVDRNVETMSVRHIQAEGQEAPREVREKELSLKPRLRRPGGG